MSDYATFARLYDFFYEGIADDIPLYQGFAERTGGRVLEIGVGTGRVAVPLAQAGCTVTGLDSSDAMLAIAQAQAAKAGVADRVQLVRADMRRFELGARFDLVIVPINTFMHNLTLDDQLDTLTHIRRHLAPPGLLVIDLFNPDPTLPDDRRLILQRVRPGPGGQPVLQFTTRALDWEHQVSAAMFIVDEPNEEGFIRRTTFAFELRFLFRNEVELLLRQTGFTLEAVYGSYDLAPFEAGAEKLIVVARPSPSPASLRSSPPPSPDTSGEGGG
ncbi:MAG TPA: class I SAM-dependent methyltransferase [Anaerolineae bacterium]|nr:class I SAM-dependent methyltransferase [Anaerolineae bacterium]